MTNTATPAKIPPEGAAKAKRQKREKTKPRLSHQAAAEQSLTYGRIDEYHDPTIARVAIQVGAIAVVGFLGWAALAPVHELTVGMGEILPTGFVQRVQHFEGGNVAAILVQEGASVKAGDALIRLDETSIRGELAKAQSRLEFIRLAIQRQQFASLGENAGGLFTYDSERFQALLDSQQIASQINDEFKTAQLSVIDAEVAMKSAELTSVKIRLDKAIEEYAIVSRQAVDYEAAVASGAISRRDYEDILREKIRLESEKAALEGQLLLSEAAVQEANARAIELGARFRQEAATEIAELEIQREETEELVTQLEDRLKRLVLRAPVDGTVNNLAVRNPGQVITPGEMVAEIVPGVSSFFAEVDIPTDQIGFVHPGMEANIKVLTFDFARFGSIEATVVDVSPTSIMNERGEYFYRVRLEMDDIYVGDPADGRRIGPGMAVTADIKLGDKSVLSYLLKPLRALSDRAFSER